MLNKLNGWQRLWLVLTAAAWLWLVGYLYVEVYGFKSYEYEYRAALEKDLAAPQCQPYAKAPWGALIEPEYGAPCWHLFTSRKLSENKALPYALAVHDREERSQKLASFSGALGLLSLALFISAGFVYFVGFVVAWIFRGFRSKQPT